jgi:hypothetical protein
VEQKSSLLEITDTDPWPNFSSLTPIVEYASQIKCTPGDTVTKRVDLRGEPLDVLRGFRLATFFLRKEFALFAPYFVAPAKITLVGPQKDPSIAYVRPNIFPPIPNETKLIHIVCDAPDFNQEN